MKPFQSNPNYKIIKCKSEEIIGILGTDPEIYADVLNHVIMKTSKMPQVVELMEKRNCPLFGQSTCTTPEQDEIRQFRKLSIMRSTHKHDKAKEVSQLLRENVNSVDEIANVTGENKQNVYRLLSTPKKRVKQGVCAKTQLR